MVNNKTTQEARDNLLKPYFENFENNIKQYDWAKSGYLGGCQRYSGLPVKELQECFDKGYILPDDQQNDAPPAQKFLEFITKYPVFTVHGYVVDATRPDFRMTIEGLEGQTDDKDKQEEFVTFCRNADENKVHQGHCYSWWD